MPLRRRHAWMDHCRQADHRGRSAGHPERSRRDSPHPIRSDVPWGQRPAGMNDRNVPIWHDALLPRRSPKHTGRSKGPMPGNNALHFLRSAGPILTWCAGRTAVTCNGLWIAQIAVITGLPAIPQRLSRVASSARPTRRWPQEARFTLVAGDEAEIVREGRAQMRRWRCPPCHRRAPGCPIPRRPWPQESTRLRSTHRGPDFVPRRRPAPRTIGPTFALTSSSKAAQRLQPSSIQTLWTPPASSSCN